MAAQPVGQQEEVEFLVKNPSRPGQSDFRLRVPAAATVREVKQALHLAYPGSPLPSAITVSSNAGRCGLHWGARKPAGVPHAGVAFLLSAEQGERHTAKLCRRPPSPYALSLFVVPYTGHLCWACAQGRRRVAVQHPGAGEPPPWGGTECLRCTFERSVPLMPLSGPCCLPGAPWVAECRPHHPPVAAHRHQTIGRSASSGSGTRAATSQPPSSPCPCGCSAATAPTCSCTSCRDAHQRSACGGGYCTGTGGRSPFLCHHRCLLHLSRAPSPELHVLCHGAAFRPSAPPHGSSRRGAPRSAAATPLWRRWRLWADATPPPGQLAERRPWRRQRRPLPTSAGGSLQCGAPGAAAAGSNGGGGGYDGSSSIRAV